jgi:hypothetical protein
MVRAFVVTLTTVLTFASAAGCDLSRLQPGGPKPSATSAAPAGPAYHAKPKLGECHKLTLKDISAESDTKKPVPCSDKHTTLTIAVVKTPGAAARGSNDAQAYAVGKACGTALNKVLGADAETRAKTLYSLAWFLPTKAQKAKGAAWMRCDVTLTDQRHAYALKNKTPFLDDDPEDNERVCGRINPDKDDSWELVPCSVKHQFVPRKYIPAAKGTSFKDAEVKAEKACKTHGPLYTWSHAEKWGSGERFYICWDIIEGSLPKEHGGDEIVV